MNKLTLDFSAISNRICRLNYYGKSDVINSFHIEALKNLDEVFINEIKLDSISLDLSKDRFVTPIGDFEVSYDLSIPFTQYIGAHVDVEMNYPYANANEIYLGSGILPVFEQGFDIELINLPQDWKVFSNVVNKSGSKEFIPLEKINQFFIYITKDTPVYFADNFQCLIVDHACLPLTNIDLFEFCKKSVSTYEKFFGENKKIKDIKLLVLQSPKNFKALGRGMTMSTAENFTGGIVVSGPDLEENYKPLGHTSYHDFLCFALQHEIGHAYITANPDGKLKSLLYPSRECSRDHRYLLGEGLNSYFNNPSRLLFDNYLNLSIKLLIESFLEKISRGGNSYILDLFLFDCNLRAHYEISLYRVFKAMLDEKRIKDTPYQSVNDVFEKAEQLIGSQLDFQMKNFLIQPDPKDYKSSLLKAIQLQKWDINKLPEDKQSLIDFIFEDD